MPSDEPTGPEAHFAEDSSYRPTLAADVGEGSLLGVSVAGRSVVLARIDGQLFALDGACSHQYAALENGRLSGDTVVCHFHGSAFDIRTGAVVTGPATQPLQVHAVSLEDDRVFIDGSPALTKVGYSGLRDNG